MLFDRRRWELQSGLEIRGIIIDEIFIDIRATNTKTLYNINCLILNKKQYIQNIFRKDFYYFICSYYNGRCKKLKIQCLARLNCGVVKENYRIFQSKYNLSSSIVFFTLFLLYIILFYIFFCVIVVLAIYTRTLDF